MSTRRRLLPLLPYLIATATVTLGLVLAPPDATIDPDAELDTSHVVDLSVVGDRYELVDDETSDPVADCLIAQGYRGLPGDGQAVIYAPAAVVEGCAR